MARALTCALLTFVALGVVAEAAPPCSSLQECQAENARLSAENARLAAEVTELREAAGLELEAELEAEPGLMKPGSPGFIRNCVMAFACVVFAALAAGLTMGLVSLEPMQMEIIAKSEEKDMIDEKDKAKLKADQACAQSILPLIQDHHRLLVTLLLMNSLANEALPLFLDKLVPSWMAVILSVTLVLMFGEIIPSAVFTGSEQLRIAAKFAGMVSALRCLLAPVAWPIAKVLDKLLGEDHKGRYNFAELRAIVGIHARLASGEPQPVAFKAVDDQGLGIITTDTPHSFTDQSIVTFSGISTKLRSDGTLYYVKPCAPLKGRDRNYTFQLYSNEGRHTSDVVNIYAGDISSGAFTLQVRDELKILHGVMLLTHMTAKDAMVPLSKAYMLEGSQRLTQTLLQEILDSGFSRVPIFSTHKHNLRGFILVKKLIVVSPEDDHGKGRLLESLGVESLVVVPPSIPMLDLLNEFQASRCHLALVTNMPDEVKKAWSENVAIPPDVHMAGIITLEDVIEKLLQEDIEDEHDAFKRRSNTISETFQPNMVTRRHSERWGRSPTTLSSTLEEPLLQFQSSPDMLNSQSSSATGMGEV